MNSQDKEDPKKFKEPKEQRNKASKKYNTSHSEEIKIKRLLKHQMKKTMEVKDLISSVDKVK